MLTPRQATISNPASRRATLMHFSLGQAANEPGLDKSTIARAIQSGNLSAPRQDNGSSAIDPAAWLRVFAPASKATTQPGLPGDPTLDGWAGNQALRLQWAAAPLRLREQEEESRDLRHRLDTAGEARRQLTMMRLASQHAAPPKDQESHHGAAPPSIIRHPPPLCNLWPPLLLPPRKAVCGVGDGGRERSSGPAGSARLARRTTVVSPLPATPDPMSSDVFHGTG